MSEIAERTETQIRQDLNAVKRIISRGVGSMSYDGRTVTYRDLDDLRSIQASLEAELGQTAGAGAAKQTRFFADVTKGYR